MLLDGSRYDGRLPCLFCRHARRPKTPSEWRDLCGRCRGLSDDELSILWWYQEKEGERVVVPPNMLRHSRENSDARYAAALEAIKANRAAPGGRLLDIGCGISAQADLFRDFRYVGADLDRPRLGRARATHPWAAYALQDITRMGWKTRAFDVVLCLEVIEHIPPKLRADLLRELLRVLRPGGLLVLSTPNGEVTPWKRLLGRKCERSHERELTMFEVEALVAQAGGALLHARSVDNLILPAGRIAAGVIHLVAGRSGPRRRLQQLASQAGYETVLYVVSPITAGTVTEPALVRGQ